MKMSLTELTLRSTVLACFAAALACGPPQSVSSERRGDPNTAAGKVGQAAHKAAVQVDKAGRVVGRKLDKAAHDVHEGWKEASRSDSSKKQ